MLAAIDHRCLLEIVGRARPIVLEDARWGHREGQLASVVGKHGGVIGVFLVDHLEVVTLVLLGLVRSLVMGLVMVVLQVRIVRVGRVVVDLEEEVLLPTLLHADEVGLLLLSVAGVMPVR